MLSSFRPRTALAGISGICAISLLSRNVLRRSPLAGDRRPLRPVVTGNVGRNRDRGNGFGSLTRFCDRGGPANLIAIGSLPRIPFASLRFSLSCGRNLQAGRRRSILAFVEYLG